MQDRAFALNILEGMADPRHGKLPDKSILDRKEEDCEEEIAVSF
jgi:hypothetical protein